MYIFYNIGGIKEIFPKPGSQGMNVSGTSVYN